MYDINGELGYHRLGASGLKRYVYVGLGSVHCMVSWICYDQCPLQQDCSPSALISVPPRSVSRSRSPLWQQCLLYSV